MNTGADSFLGISAIFIPEEWDKIMTVIETAKVTSKGQITIPNRIRKILHLEEGASVAFGVGKEGVVLLPCKVSAESPYTAKEWAKIEKLASKKGRSFSGAESAKSPLKSL